MFRLITTLAVLQVSLQQNYRTTRVNLSGWALRRFWHGHHRLTLAADRAGNSVDAILNRIQVERLHTATSSF